MPPVLSRCLAILLALALALPAQALTLVRDAELEHALKVVMRPLQRAAGVGGRRVELFILHDRELNAFVAGGDNIFLTTALLTRLKTPEMLQAVLAHELAHITQGHRAQRAADIASARTAAGLGLAVGLAAAVAGGGPGVAAGLHESLRRSMLAFSRAQENAADQASVRYLRAAGVGPQAALDVLALFRGQEALNIGRQDPYVRTHPLTSERIERLRAEAARFKGEGRTDATTAYWHARMRTKLGAFIGNPSATLRALPRGDTGELATLARAIAYHRLPKPVLARQHADRLVRLRPKDAYYHDLRAQILLESGDARGAVAALRRAVALAPSEPLLLGGLGRALLAKGSGGSPREALGVLQKAYAQDPRDPLMLRNLAVAYARTGNPGMASVVTAERYALASDFKQAQIHAQRAQRLLPRGTPGWLKADDILAIARRALARK